MTTLNKLKGDQIESITNGVVPNLDSSMLIPVAFMKIESLNVFGGDGRHFVGFAPPKFEEFVGW